MTDKSQYLRWAELMNVAASAIDPDGAPLVLVERDDLNTLASVLEDAEAMRLSVNDLVAELASTKAKLAALVSVLRDALAASKEPTR